MTTPRTGRPRGRPIEPIRTDPQRYVIALARAMVELGASRRKAFDFAAALAIGRRAPPLPGFNVSFEKILAPGLPATFAGLAATLRQKSKRHDDRWKANVSQTLPRGSDEYIEAMWLLMMTAAFKFTLGAKDEGLSGKVVGLADEVGERDYAERTLVPMMRAKLKPPD